MWVTAGDQLHTHPPEGSCSYQAREVGGGGHVPAAAARVPAPCLLNMPHRQGLSHVEGRVYNKQCCGYDGLRQAEPQPSCQAAATYYMYSQHVVPVLALQPLEGAHAYSQWSSYTVVCCSGCW